MLHKNKACTTVDVFQILTKDSVTVHVDAIMYYKVSNAICAISNVDDYGQSTRLLAATTLRYIRQTHSQTRLVQHLCVLRSFPPVVSQFSPSLYSVLHFILNSGAHPSLTCHKCAQVVTTTVALCI